MSDSDQAHSTAVLRLIGISRTYQVGEVQTEVLRGVDLEIREGEITVVVGASGSGKTTLLNIAGGMDRPTSGQVLFGNTDLARLDDAELTSFRRTSLGFVFQFYNLVPTATALENVRVATDIADDPMDPADALRLVGLAPRMDHFPSQMSGGEQQRVAIARAIAKNPKILFCDEPTGALDSRTGKVVLQLLGRLNRELATTIVVITHNVPISRMAHRIVHISSGVVDRMEVNQSPVSVEEITW